MSSDGSSKRISRPGDTAVINRKLAVKPPSDSALHGRKTLKTLLRNGFLPAVTKGFLMEVRGVPLTGWDEPNHPDM